MTWEYLLIPTAYFLGAVPFGLVIAKWVKGIDVREHGSRNIGFTNVLRVCGKATAIPVLILDILKGFAPVLAARWLAPDSDWLAVVCGAAAMAGHSYSVYLGFKGGKAVATGAGVFLALQWEALLIAALVLILVLWTTRYMSLSSMLAAASLLAVLLVEWLWLPSRAPSVPVLIVACAANVLVIVRHRENIKRLLNGTENKLGRSSGSSGNGQSAGNEASQETNHP